MKEYTKPVVEVTSEAAEGVYTASGFTPWMGNGLSGCNSPSIRGDFKLGTFKVPATVKEYYGCNTCPACNWSDKCNVKEGTTYTNNDGYRFPSWEPQLPADRTIYSVGEEWTW